MKRLTPLFVSCHVVLCVCNFIFRGLQMNMLAKMDAILIFCDIRSRDEFDASGKRDDATNEKGMKDAMTSDE